MHSRAAHTVVRVSAEANFPLSWKSASEPPRLAGRAGSSQLLLPTQQMIKCFFEQHHSSEHSMLRQQAGSCIIWSIILEGKLAEAALPSHNGTAAAGLQIKALCARHNGKCSAKNAAIIS